MRTEKQRELRHLVAPLTATALAVVAMTGCGGNSEENITQPKAKIVESSPSGDPDITGYELKEVAHTAVQIGVNDKTDYSTYNETYTVNGVIWTCSVTVTDSQEYRAGGGVAKSCVTGTK